MTTDREPSGHTPGVGVVVDIGGDMGALVVHCGAGDLGAEIEICPCGHEDRRQHNVVRARPVGERTHYAAVFPQLPAGDYTLLVGDPGIAVRVPAAGVAEVDLRAAAPGASLRQHAHA